MWMLNSSAYSVWKRCPSERFFIFESAVIERNILNIFILECTPQVVVIDDIEILVEEDIG